MRSHLFLCVLFLGCSTKDPGNADGGDAAVDDFAQYTKAWDRPTTRPANDEAKAKHTACGYKAGDMPSETLGASTPVDKDIPIDTIVILMQENRSFDHYFSQLPAFLNRMDIAVAPANASNPDKAGGATGTHLRTHAPHMCNYDVNHEWAGSHVQYDDGKMDGFFETNDDAAKAPNGAPPELYNGDRALWYYDQTDLPFYYDLAKTFGIADHYHCSLLGPTWPNRMFLYGATSFGYTHNAFPSVLNEYAFPEKDMTFLDMLEKRHVTWSIFTDGAAPGLGVVYGGAGYFRWGDHKPVQTLTAFNSLAAAGTLPAVSLVDPILGKEGGGQNDEHPPADVQVGQKFVFDIVTTLMKSPQWKRMAIFVTYDEHGGFYDSVPPPAACPPDARPQNLEPGDTTNAKFDRLGFRVPLFVISPYTKKGYIAHDTYDHASIARFVEAKFKLPALTARDANADVPMEFFDFQNPPYMTPPMFTAPPVDPTALSFCTTNFPPK